MILTIFDGLSTHLQKSKISQIYESSFLIYYSTSKDLDLGHNNHAKK